MSWDTAVLMYITGKCYFYHKSASASGNTSYLNAVPASPVGISVVTQTNAAICLFLHPQVALWHCSPLTCLLRCAKSTCAVLLERILCIDKVSISCLLHLPSLALAILGKKHLLLSPALLCGQCCTEQLGVCDFAESRKMECEVGLCEIVWEVFAVCSLGAMLSSLRQC